MTDHYEEEAQLEDIKRWWQENHRTLIFSLVLGCSVWGGWHAWHWYKTSQQIAGSEDFAKVIDAKTLDDLNQPVYDAMEKRSFSGAYGPIAKLKKAQLLVLAERYDEGATLLERLLDSSYPDALDSLIRIRLARLYDQLERDESILEVLKTIESSPWSAWANYLRSHAHRRMNDSDQANALLHQAKEQIQEDSLLQRLVLMDSIQYKD